MVIMYIVPEATAASQAQPLITKALMRFAKPVLLTFTALTLSVPAMGQSAPTDYRDEILRHFDGSSRKLQALVEAIPEEKFGWSPGPGVMTIAQVYTHIAEYNYGYLVENLGVEAPSDVDVSNLQNLTDKADVTAALTRSVEFVRAHASKLSEENLTDATRLYGRQVAGWAVLLQLVSHMNEHVGQSVSYARMNGIAPPWSRPSSEQ